MNIERGNDGESGGRLKHCKLGILVVGWVEKDGRILYLYLGHLY